MPSRDLSAELEARLRRARVLPVLRSPSVAAAAAQVEQCVAARLDVIELTTSVPDWRVALAEARSSFPGRLFGVGTVLTAPDAQDAIASGAAFLVSPCPAPAVRRVAAGRVPFIEGGMTVREVLAAADRGIAKLFPASLGGQQFLRAVLDLRPAARIVPTGGIPVADVPGWLAAGALAVGVGGGLLREPDLPTAIRKIIEGDTP
jgi:2-dehydro-3-deoxyphosphogluconate aldolase / (4S)-4-hydroxy-2-oxoglutarate aldolase